MAEVRLIRCGRLEGIPITLLEPSGSTDRDWMRAEAKGSRPPSGIFGLKNCLPKDHSVAIERFLSDPEFGATVWLFGKAGDPWPDAPTWSVFDCTDLVANLPPSAVGAALADLPPCPRPTEILLTTLPTPVVLDEIYSYLDPEDSAWLYLKDVDAGLRVVSKASTPWGVRRAW